MPASSRLRTGTYWSWPPAESSERTCIFAWPLWSSSSPLRERVDDIILVAKAFPHNYAVEHAKPSLTFAPDALRALGLHRWPGNVRGCRTRCSGR